MSKGWFKIPGVQDGDRTLDEQMLGVTPALECAVGRRVLDLGCAEGLIALEFARAGAAVVDGIEYNKELIAVARQRGRKSLLNVSFEHDDLNLWLSTTRKESWDIVLALAILHKLHDPAAAARAVAAITRERLVVRLPIGSTGVFASKYTQRVCDLPAVLAGCGMVLALDVAGARGERVQHWVRR